MIEYFILFGSAFLAATILPFYSEFVLFALVEEDGFWLPVLVATTGNTLGALVNWWLGKELLRFQNKRWFYFSESQIARAQRWFSRYGKWSLLMAWAPIGGDALTLIAGIMRIPIPVFLILVGLGKLVRYVLVGYLSLSGALI